MDIKEKKTYTGVKLEQSLREKAVRIAIDVTGQPSMTTGIAIALKKYKLNKGKQ